ncbi:hypothetical protein B0H14DRAFT_3427288 [Mycena olivaceomarginata]|nr:hypothetical protein B0H14DRAFT_3427288 [Mycena olivaceomarginata]
MTTEGCIAAKVVEGSFGVLSFFDFIAESVVRYSLFALMQSAVLKAHLRLYNASIRSAPDPIRELEAIQSP